MYIAMILRKFKDFHMHDNSPEVKIGKKWCTEKETDDMIMSCGYCDIVGAA